MFLIKRFSALVTALTLSASVCSAQNEPAKRPPDGTSSTKLEAFLGKRGSLLVRDFYDTGVLSKRRDLSSNRETKKIYVDTKEMADDKGDAEDLIINAETITVNALAVYEPGGEKTKVKGLQFSLYKYERSGSDSNLSFVDVDEARSLSKALQYLVDASGKPKEDAIESREVKFSTRDDLVIILSQSKDGSSSAYVTSGTIGRVDIELLSVQDLNDLRDMVDKGIAWLEKQ